MVRSNFLYNSNTAGKLSQLDSIGMVQHVHTLTQKVFSVYDNVTTVTGHPGCGKTFTIERMLRMTHSNKELIARVACREDFRVLSLIQKLQQLLNNARSANARSAGIHVDVSTDLPKPLMEEINAMLFCLIFGRSLVCPLSGMTVTIPKEVKLDIFIEVQV